MRSGGEEEGWTGGEEKRREAEDKMRSKEEPR